jgi:rod shape-determining protein MreD
MASLPIVVEAGWFPDLGFLMLIAWRLLRADVWPAWWAAPLGLLNDLLTGYPIGLSVTVWTLSMLALDLVDRRTLWRDYWIEWALAALLILFNEAAQWQVAAWMGAPVPFTAMIPPIVISIAAFPVAAWIVGRLDRWRSGRQ